MGESREVLIGWSQVDFDASIATACPEAAEAMRAGYTAGTGAGLTLSKVRRDAAGAWARTKIEASYTPDLQEGC